MRLGHDPVDGQALSDWHATIRRLHHLHWDPAIENPSGFREEIAQLARRRRQVAAIDEKVGFLNRGERFFFETLPPVTSVAVCAIELLRKFLTGHTSAAFRRRGTGR